MVALDDAKVALDSAVAEVDVAKDAYEAADPSNSSGA